MSSSYKRRHRRQDTQEERAFGEPQTEWRDVAAKQAPQGTTAATVRSRTREDSVQNLEGAWRCGSLDFRLPGPSVRVTLLREATWCVKAARASDKGIRYFLIYKMGLWHLPSCLRASVETTCAWHLAPTRQTGSRSRCPSCAVLSELAVHTTPCPSTVPASLHAHPRPRVHAHTLLCVPLCYVVAKPDVLPPSKTCRMFIFRQA